MPIFEFDTPEPILVTIGLDIGHVRLTAGDRSRTTVEVRALDRDDASGVATAGRAGVAYTAGELVVSAPTARGLQGIGAVIVDIELPSGSRVHGNALAADFRGTGRLGECRITAGCGHIRLDRTGPLLLSSVLGNVDVQHVAGDFEAVAGSGDVYIREIDGAVEANRGTGDIRIGEVSGGVRVYADSGDLHIGRAHAAVEARATQGDIRIDAMLRGPLVLETASGKLEVGIPEGVRAHLDLDSHVGTVYQSLDFLDSSARKPEADAETVKVQARTLIGDIVIRRAALDLDEEWP
ncbi:DUF4097 family beta strand repeat-containing protein [Streptomyces sp. NBC_00503]|uniref:DUF4097 family beta strand repeat-containing protein n=1 Tax=Streptomyces sp. NBC_00503 TaxID=2903659 RepID=UPI002E80FC52|nr:DUF4097 family beta strand repeat-containing protein [Streptomyces sp. NBC_00503]WUD84374.1 DUF4097 domain-containing protein [Streptomyces sp. NBC_00503]